MADEISGVAWAAVPLQWAAQDWPDARTLAALHDCNERFLALLCAQAEQPACAAFCGGLGTLLPELEAAARARAARCAVLLADTGFADAGRWARALRGGCGEPDYAPGAFFTGRAAVDVMRAILTCAAHLTHADPAAARVLLGMSPGCVEVFAGSTVTRVAALADLQWHWLRPRWPNRLGYWRDLLFTATAGTAAAQARMRVRGLQLLAGETRPG